MKNEYSISKTTKEQRENYVAGALAITSLDSSELTPEDQKILNQYVEGEAELSEITQKIIEKYKE